MTNCKCKDFLNNISANTKDINTSNDMNQPFIYLLKKNVKTSLILLFFIPSLTYGGNEGDEKIINLLINTWHQAAAEADEEVFFGSMTADCIYIGTDPAERWVRDSLKKWSEPFFNRESAWSFKPYDRQINFSEDGNTAWFDELLETWMGICRSTGVVVKTSEGWKLSHYQLSVTIQNELIGDFIELIKKDPRNNFLKEE